MTILHVGHFSPHVHQMMRLLWRCRESLLQEVVGWGQAPMLAPDLVFVHGFHDNPAEVERILSWGVPVVARPWNDRWLSRPGQREQVQGLLPRLSLVVGSPFSALKAQCPAPWCDITTLVDADVFKPENGFATGPEIRFFAARLLERDREGVYWGDEINRAFAGMEVLTASGYASENQMAEQLRRSVVVLSLCGTEWGPSNTTVEAILCGKVPVLADTPAQRAHFPEGVGARFAQRSGHSIRLAVNEVLELSNEQRAAEVARNLEYFAGWTLQAQAKRIGDAVLGLLSRPQAEGGRVSRIEFCDCLDYGPPCEKCRASLPVVPPSPPETFTLKVRQLGLLGGTMQVIESTGPYKAGDWIYGPLGVPS